MRSTYLERARLEPGRYRLIDAAQTLEQVQGQLDALLPQLLLVCTVAGGLIRGKTACGSRWPGAHSTLMPICCTARRASVSGRWPSG